MKLQIFSRDPLRACKQMLTPASTFVDAGVNIVGDRTGDYP